MISAAAGLARSISSATRSRALAEITDSGKGRDA
jgi:hypothetical protein